MLCARVTDRASMWWISCGVVICACLGGGGGGGGGGLFFFQAEDGIRYLVRSRGLGDVYKRQVIMFNFALEANLDAARNVATGLLWATILLAGTLGLNRSLAIERENLSLIHI